jgi:hypothetical protein
MIVSGGLYYVLGENWLNGWVYCEPHTVGIHAGYIFTSKSCIARDYSYLEILHHTTNQKTSFSLSKFLVKSRKIHHDIFRPAGRDWGDE